MMTDSLKPSPPFRVQIVSTCVYDMIVARGGNVSACRASCCRTIRRS